VSDAYFEPGVTKEQQANQLSAKSLNYLPIVFAAFEMRLMMPTAAGSGRWLPIWRPSHPAHPKPKRWQRFGEAQGWPCTLAE